MNKIDKKNLMPLLVVGGVVLYFWLRGKGGAQPDQYCCPYGCDLCFSTAKELADHIAEAHPDQDQWCCPYPEHAGLCFPDSVSLQIHLDTAHKIYPQWCCPYEHPGEGPPCFDTEAELIAHIAAVHGSEPLAAEFLSISVKYDPIEQFNWQDVYVTVRNPNSDVSISQNIEIWGGCTGNQYVTLAALETRVITLADYVEWVGTGTVHTSSGLSVTFVSEPPAVPTYCCPYPEHAGLCFDTQAELTYHITTVHQAHPEGCDAFEQVSSDHWIIHRTGQADCDLYITYAECRLVGCNPLNPDIHYARGTYFYDAQVAQINACSDLPSFYRSISWWQDMLQWAYYFTGTPNPTQQATLDILRQYSPGTYWP